MPAICTRASRAGTAGVCWQRGPDISRACCREHGRHPACTDRKPGPLPREGRRGFGPPWSASAGRPWKTTSPACWPVTGPSLRPSATRTRRSSASSSTRLHVPGYTDFREMFKAEQPDFAVVCVPHHAGREVIEAAAAQHIHVLKEKPFAASMEEAKELAETCRQAGIQLMVTLQRRFNPIYTSFTPTGRPDRHAVRDRRPVHAAHPRPVGRLAGQRPPRRAAGASSTWATTSST